MFKIAGKTDLNQISLTGIRALVLMGLLMKKPCSLEEIREEFINMQIMEQTHSDDILRIDLNTIKSMGCKISRSSPKTGYKYVLSKHPFEFKISNEELSSLKKVYNYAKSKIDLDTLIEYDDLFNKIALHICDEQTKEAILGVSVLKYYNISMIKDLICDCKYKNVLGLMYQTSGNSKEHKKQIVAQEIVYKNDKIYLYGYDLDKESPIVLNLRRIKSIISRKIQKGKIEPKLVKVKFLTANFTFTSLGSILPF